MCLEKFIEFWTKSVIILGAIAITCILIITIGLSGYLAYDIVFNNGENTFNKSVPTPQCNCVKKNIIEHNKYFMKWML